MSKGIKVWLILAIVLILAGCAIFGGSMTAMNWNFLNLSADFNETTYELTDPFNNITVETDTADVIFLPAEDGKISVVCRESKKEPHAVAVEGDTLCIQRSDLRKWYERIGINFESPSIKVYLPAGEYGALEVKLSTGNIEIPQDFRFKEMDLRGATGSVTNGASVAGTMKICRSTGKIRLEGVSAQTIELEVSTGKTTLKDVTCNSLSTLGDTGNLSMEKVIAAEGIKVERSTGDVRLEGCDAKELTVKTDTGDVQGTLLSEKIFTVRTDTGKVKVPDSTQGGVCKIETSTGDISIEIERES